MTDRQGTAALRLVEFTPDLAPVFRDIKAEWIGAMYRIEPTDRAVLENPYERIIAPGGDILFVEADGLGVVGTCALQKTGPDQYELTKMGVLPAARGTMMALMSAAVGIGRIFSSLSSDFLYLNGGLPLISAVAVLASILGLIALSRSQLTPKR